MLGIYLFGQRAYEPDATIDLAKRTFITCGPVPGEQVNADETGKFIAALPGWGDYAYAISTDNDSAQFYFNQGLNMYYSYHMKEATASFKEAARIDSACAMAYWGQALAMGPYYNSAHNYTLPNAVPGVVEKMNKANGRTTAKEKQLIAVMNQRYKGGIQHEKYALALKNLISEHPDDADIKTLYIDAVMLMHPWDFWHNNGTAKDWTPEVADLCENVLRSNPRHPGALHYYIHLTEASRHPEVALANAQALKEQLPGVAHMVHMASHEYERNGLYADGVDANDKATDNLVSYDSLASHLYLNTHSSHYYAVQTYCAMSGGMYDTGMRNAMRCRSVVSPSYGSTYAQYLYMMPVLTLVRLGKWEEILQDQNIPDSQWPYASLLHDFARGLAFVHAGKPDSAAYHLSQLRNKTKDPVLNIRRVPFNSPAPCAGIAEGILNAAVLFAEKKYDAAVSSLNKAIQLEDSLIYTEPKDWPIPARQFLGAYLLKMDQPAMAEKVYREDLVWNPGNGWSLLGLCQSLEAQGKKEDVKEYKARYLRSFSHADAVPPASAYIPNAKAT